MFCNHLRAAQANVATCLATIYMPLIYIMQAEA